MIITCTPAFGRTYTTPEAAHRDWQLGKDFSCISPPRGWVGGPYFSIRDCKPGDQVWLLTHTLDEPYRLDGAAPVSFTDYAEKQVVLQAWR